MSRPSAGRHKLLSTLIRKPTNTRRDTGVQSDVPRDYKTFKLHASGCGCESLSFACVCSCCLKSLDVILPGLNCLVESAVCPSFHCARTLVVERGNLLCGV